MNSNTKKTYTFTYDDNGNITSISVNGTVQNRYKYDDIGQLTREDNVASGRTYVYTYDNAGNILTKKIYSIAAATATPSSLISTLTYTYGNESWGDQLTKYNGTTITYDAIGNPLSYYNGLRYVFTWKNGRQLSTINGAATLSFEYNEEGIRTSKTANGVEHIYHLNGSTIVAEEWSNKLLIYLYDANGAPIGMQYRTTSYAEGVFETYWFEKNLQGDIVAVYNDAGTLLVTYTYDAWGYLLSTQYYNSGASTAVQYNPFRYRGYYRDSETGFYYLNSRYYDPNTGRFINADGYASTGQGLLGNNMYAYCLNCATNGIDPNGEDAIWLQDKNSVASMGHTGLLIQDNNGKWWHFYWGANRNGSKGKKGTGNILMRYEGNLNLYAINDFYKEHYGNEYEAMIYFKGDFSKSVSYAKKLDEKGYNFLFNNCMEVSTDVLKQGKFKNNDAYYKLFLTKMRTVAVPNIAYRRMQTFHSSVQFWDSTPWYLKSGVISPAKAVLLY